MTESVYVNRDRSRVVGEGSPEAAWKIHAKEAKRLGLLSEQPKANKIVEPEQLAPNGDAPKRTYTRRATKDQ
ncbi:MAG: hypothetical protein LC667_00915 [Thioalkalivibrio sp.]|nr:hypothetical protein [Thioalkalivibrio sp.]